MGTLRHRSIGSLIALAGMAAAGASGLVVLGSSAAFAAPPVIVLIAGTPVSVQEGFSTGSVTVAQFTDANTTECAPSGIGANVHWGDGSSSAGIITCVAATVEGGPPLYTVTGSHTYVDAGSDPIVVSVTDPDNTSSGTTDTATIGDESLSESERNSPNLTGVEGQLNLTAYFFDDNGTFDTQLQATIDWGDGSATSAGTVADNNCDCSGTELKVTGSHLYDAPTTPGQKYNVTVTLADDGTLPGGGTTSAQVKVTASVTDATLTAGAAKTLTVANGAVASQVVGTFTDAAGAQAAAGDFTATINWGDNATSTGSVTKTAAGAFSVSGSHTYATGGQKSIKATVKDEEGSTVTLTATAIVPVLAQTGRPSGPSWPWLPLMVLLVGAATASLGAGLRIADRKR